jgi:hypothetical protein
MTKQTLKIKQLNNNIQTTKNHIEFVGIELEGYWYDGHEELKHDSSVEGFSVDYNECQGDCRDNCDCEQYCECRSCRACENCDSSISECQCDECMVCLDCEHHFENCECIIDKICEKLSCVKNDRCDECIESFQENQTISHSCRMMNNDYNNCCMDCECECSCECNCESNNEVGEVASPKLKVNEVKDFILDNYPNECNFSCGLHIHLNFKNGKKDYNVISTEKFYNYFLFEIENWALNRNINQGSRFWKRLKGCQYAKREFNADIQIKEGSDRYTHINYCYSKHKTVEVRLGTMHDNKDISVEYVHKVIEIFNDYLNRNKPKIHKSSLIIRANGVDDFNLEIQAQQKTDGLELYIKSHNFKDIHNDVNYDSITERYSCNHKMKLFTNLVNQIKQNNEFDSLRAESTRYDTDVVNFPNMTFLKLKGLNNGQKFYIQGLYTDTMIENYLDDIEDKIEYFVEEYV